MVHVIESMLVGYVLFALLGAPLRDGWRDSRSRQEPVRVRVRMSGGDERPDLRRHRHR